MDSFSKYPLYGTTYTLFRLSPLHYADAVPVFSTAGLEQHSRRLAEAVKGNLIGGVNASFHETDEGLHRSGSFKSCKWRALPEPEERIATSEDIPPLDSADGLGLTRGIMIELEYEKITHRALLLGRSEAAHHSMDGEAQLPLLLLRMPNALRDVFVQYLSRTFDTRVELFRPSSQFIKDSLEGFIAELAGETEELVKIVKDIHLTIAFPAPAAPNLKSLDIMLRREDLSNLLVRGMALQRSMTGPSGVNGKHKPTDTDDSTGPLLAALESHIKTHLALDIKNELLFFSRVVCGAFAMGREGKIKITMPNTSSDMEDVSSEPSGPLLKAYSRLILNLLEGSQRKISG